MRQWVSGVLFILVVFAFQVSSIPFVHMHPDEELSYRATEGTLADTLHYQMSLQDNQAPGWFVTFWAWRQFVGDAEFTSRIMGMLMTVVTLAIVFRLGRRWFSTSAALAALAALGVSHYFFTYSQDIRMYPLTMLAAALSVWMFDRWRGDSVTVQLPNRRRTIAYALSLAFMLYVHYLLVFLIAAQVLFVLLFQRLNRRLVLSGMGALALAFLVWLPWFLTFVTQVVGLRNIEAASGTGRGVAGIGVSTQVTSLPTIVTLVNMATNGLPWLYALILAAGLVTLWRRIGFRLALMWAFGATAITFTANLVAGVYAPRFVSHAAMGLALAVGAALLIRPSRWRLTATGAFLALNLFMFPTQYPADRIPYRDLFHELSAQSQPGDVLLQVQGGEIDGFVDWQIAHYLPDYLQAARTSDRAQTAGARRIWMMTGDLFDPQVEADFNALEPMHPVQTVIGNCDRAWCYIIQLMEAPPLSTPLIFRDADGAHEVPFWGADVDRVTETEIGTRLWWRVAEPLDQDYSFGLHLLDTNGILVAQNDGPIVHYGAEPVPTSTMQVGRLYIDFRSLPRTASLAPGEYHLALVVYQPWDGARLTLPDGADHLVLQTLTLH